MHGPSMEIMKLSVKSLLKTFEENDFINVAWFASEVRWVSCFDTLVQANRRNKRILSKSIDRITDGGTASLSHALDFAFQNMADFQENRTTYAGAECIQMIMIFTDGGTEDPTPLVKKLNTGLKVSVSYGSASSRQRSCSPVAETRNARTPYFPPFYKGGKEYLKVLSRPMVLSGEKQFAWTNFYQDSGKDQAIVGVMGVDVSLEELKDHEPTYKIGPSGYSFMINRNGYVMYHPDIKLQLGSLEEPLDIDFLDVEIENPKKEKKHLVPQNMVYFYTHMNESEFGRYCKNVARPKGPTGNLSQVLEAYRADHRQCDPLLMQRLLWDIENTRAVVNNWTSDAFAEESIAVYLIHEANPQKAAYFRRALYAEDFVFLISNVKRKDD
ncbi:hypothetical protein ISCGN_011925, partial [Ixodes scapularis]